MAQRQGRNVINLPSRPSVTGYAAVAGKLEGEGPLAAELDAVFEDEMLGEKSFEKAESKLHRLAVEKALEKAQTNACDVDISFAGDLLDQCIGSSFAFKDADVPYAGLYGACSTMALSLALAAVAVDAGAAGTCTASVSSHFCSAERQYRLPLEYGGQRTPTAQWTATAAGCAVIKSGSTRSPVRVDSAIIGRIRDYGVKDANNMGAAMAPAAAQTIADYLCDTQTAPSDYDLILTGDLGAVGTQLLHKLLQTEHKLDITAVHNDCGLLLYDMAAQDVHAGGSGCGCSAAVVCSRIFNQITGGELKNMLFIGTGALLSPTSSLQGQTIPAVAHGVRLAAE